MYHIIIDITVLCLTVHIVIDITVLCLTVHIVIDITVLCLTVHNVLISKFILILSFIVTCLVWTQINLDINSYI